MRKMRCLVETSPSRMRLSSLRRGEVAAERLFDDDARALRCSRPSSNCSTTVPNSTAEWPGSAPAAARSRVPCGWPETSPGRCNRRRHSAAIRTTLSNAAGSRPPCFSTLSLGPRFELIEIPARLGHADDRAHRGGRASPSPAATGRFSCRPDRPWRRRNTSASEWGVIHACRSLLRPVFRGARRIGSASPTAACPGSRPRRAKLNRS